MDAASRLSRTAVPLLAAWAFVLAGSVVAVAAPSAASATPAAARATDCTIVGTRHPDVLVGTAGDDVICGRGGGDTIRARGGDDLVRAGRGDDEVLGGKGDDVLRGGRGDDNMRARGDSAYVDHVGCGTGTDRARGDAPDVIAADCEDDGIPDNAAPVAVDDAVATDEDTPLDLPVSGAGSPAANDTDADGDPLTVTAVSGAVGGTVALAGGTITFTPDPDHCGTGSFDYTVSDGNGGEDTATVTVDIACVDDAPQAVDDTKTVAEDSGATAVDVLANDTDPDGGPISIASVTQPAHGTVVITGGGSGLTYLPDAGYCNTPPGSDLDTFTYTLAPGGSSATVTVTVSCVDQAPHAVDDSATVTEDDPATPVDVLANDTDPDGGPISVGSVTQPAHGTVAITGGGTGLTYQPDPNYCNTPGPIDTFTYALAPGGSTATVTVTVTCVNDAPTAVNDTKTVAEDDPATAIAVLANDNDPEGDPISIVSVTQPANGTVVITGGGTSVTYQPNANYCNTPPGTSPDTFTYHVNGGSTATVSVTVTCVDDAPVAVNDAKTVTEDDPATAVNVLGNDTDVDGGPISITSVTQPAHGTVVITGGGTGLTYAPNANYCNDPPGTTPDTFTYTLAPGGSTATVSVTVNCVDDPPTAVNDSKTVTEDDPATAVNVLANDTDPDGGAVSISSVTQPAHGTVVITGGGTGLTYAPNANYCNNPPGTTPDTFTYSLAPGGSTATVSVTVSCVDDAPTAVNDSAAVAEDSGASAVDVLANDTDPDGGPISITSVTQPANGTVVITGGGTGLTYAPNANYCNNPPGLALDTFTYTLTPGGSTATVTMTVNCVDDPPTAVNDSAAVAEDSGASAVAVLANDTDVDGGPKSITSVTQPANGTVVITGGGTGLTYAPNANYCNNPPGLALDTFTYTLTPGGSSATVTMTVNCVDDAPVAVNDTKTVTEDDPATAVNVLANDTDVDGGPISITSVTQPANGTVVITGGGTGLTYQPNPNYCNDPPGTTPDTFTYTLTPGGSTATVSVTVTCVPDPPTAVNDSAAVAEDSGATAVDVLANDTNPDGGPISITSVTQPANGTVVITGGGTGLTYAPNANYCNNPPGLALDTFTYTLTPGGSTATVSVTVNCVDDAPTAVNDSATVAEDSGPTAVGVLANDTDPDGGPISITSVTQPANGTVVITGGGTGLSYAPNANYCNNPPGTTPDTFTYSLTPGGSTATVSVTVTCVDDAPTAVNDTKTVVEDSGATAVDVLANDTDVDGGPKSITSVTQPANGTVVITGGGTGLTYAPNANYCNDPPGTTADTFTYTLTPGGSTATVSVTVTCVDDAPTAVNDSAAVAEDSGASAVAVLANDTDPDGGPISITSVTQPANGTVVITGGGTGLTYAPNANYCNNPPGLALDTFTYTLTPGGSTATVTMTVNCVDDPPTAVNDSTTVTEDDPATAVNVLANDTDIDGGPISITSVTQPANGTVVITGGGTGLTYQPNANYCNDPPGTAPDTFTYTLTPGGSTATVSITVTCVNDAPVAGTDTFNGASAAVGNTTLVVDDPTDGPPAASGPKKSVTGDILANDTDIDSPGPLTITAGTFASTDGGSVTIQADGDFVFNPRATLSCTDHSDSFSYTLNDGDGGSSAGTVNVTTAGCVWYVSNAAAGDSGTSVAPFDTLAEAETASAANDTIYVYKGDGTANGYATGITLKSGQRLLGEIAPLQVGSDLLAAGTAGARPTLTRNGGDVVTLASGDTVRGVAIDPNGSGSGIAGSAGVSGGTITDVQIVDTSTAGTQPALDLVSTSGTFAVSDLVVDNTAASGRTSGSEGVNLSNAGTVTFDPASTITIATAGARALDVSGTALGTSTFDSITVTGSGTGGVSVTGSSGTLTFAALSLTTTSGTSGAFVMSSHTGTAVVTGSSNTLSATGGPALSVSSTTIGSAGMTFRTVSASGGSNGIVLNTTGSQGSLVVTGNGGTCVNGNTAGCTGGTIASTTGADDSGVTPVGTGIVLNSTLAPSFTRMWIHDHSNYGVRGNAVSGFTLATSVVNGANGTTASSPYVDSSLSFDNLTGSASVTSTYISGGYADNLRVDNTTGNLDRITVDSSTFGTSGTTPNNDALYVGSEVTGGVLKATVTNSTFTSAAGDLFQFDHNGISTGDLVLTGNTFSNANPAIATGGGGLSLFQGGTAGNSTTMQVNGNTFRDAVGPGVLIVKGAGTSTQQGKFYNNTIGVSGTANSGSAEGSTLKIQDVGGGTDAWSVDGNTIYGYNNFGVEFLAGGSGTVQAGSFETRVTGNTVAQPGNTAGTLTVAKQGVHYNIGTTVGDTFAACANITGNTLDQSGADTVPSTPFNFDVRLRQRQATTIRLPGYGGLNNDNAAVATFVAGNNSAGTSVTASNTVPTGGGFTGGAACATPSIP
ncbi:MAG TPA: Ig-like domain-containing protein [Nocardioides sp.]|nr:Ig-like domain-containing protein [Nocardioides sp.]